MTSRKQILYMVLLVVLAGGMPVWLYGQLQAHRAEAARAARQYHVARVAAAVIAANRDQDSRTMEIPEGTHDVRAATEKAAQQAEIPLSALIDVTPQSTRRFGQSQYVEQPIRIKLDYVSLRQLVSLLHTLSTPSVGLVPRAIHIRAPRDEGPEETWLVELIVSRLDYLPAEQPKRSP